jgi:hypothetical protein
LEDAVEIGNETPEVMPLILDRIAATLY